MVELRHCTSHAHRCQERADEQSHGHLGSEPREDVRCSGACCMRSVAWLLLSFFAVEALGQDCAPLAMNRASARVEYDESASRTGHSTAIFFEPADTGALRARDEATGRVLWTFFPPELGQARTSGDLMTSIAVLRFDANADGVIDIARGDRVWLYFGLRRGGPWYYALDVTRRAPRVLWKAGSSQLDGLGEA